MEVDKGASKQTAEKQREMHEDPFVLDCSGPNSLQT